MKTIKAKVYRLPTEQGIIASYKKTGNLAKPNFNVGIFESDVYQPQHLYITTDEDTKKGDWVLARANGKEDGEWFISLCRVDGQIYKHQRKIIATTDPNLFVNVKNHLTSSEGLMVNVPQIPQSFIEEYCKAGGIDEVLVEYEQHCSAISDYIQRRPIDRNVYLKPALKDNIIIIHPVEENSVNAKALEVCRRIISFMDASPELKGTTMIEIYNKANRCLESNPVEEKMYSGEEIVKKFKNLIPQLPITQSDMEGMTEDWIIEKLEL